MKEKALPFVLFNITNSCNLRCKHCLFDSREGEDTELNRKEVFDIFDDLRDEGVRLVSFTGGEPMNVPFFVDLLEKISDDGFHIKVNTNGTLLDKDNVERLKELNIFEARVSLDGPNAQVNDRLRGEGTFDKITKGISLLNDSGLPVTLATTLTQHNYRHAPELVDLAGNVDVKMMNFYRLVERGRGKNLSDIVPRDEHIEEFRELMKDRESFEPKENVGCDEGYTFIEIKPDGDVILHRESSLHGSGENPIGNLRDDDFELPNFSETIDCSECDYFASTKCKLLHNYCELDVIP